MSARGAKRRPGAALLLVILVPLALLALAAGAGFAALAYLGRPAEGIPPDGALYAVEKGASASAVARDLEARGLLRSSLAFRALAKARGVESELKAGTYRVEPGTGAAALLSLLVSGRQALARVTIPEGSTLLEVASVLEEAGILPRADFLAAARDPALVAELGVPAASLEGYLFPDTYFLPHGYPARDLLEALLATFRARLASIPEAALLGPAELHEKVVLASIIEREYRIADEAPAMASVFYNRLRIGMALQSCATVVYVITEKQGKPHPEVIYDRDIRIPDPYNTYIRPGLPPGPISNPGLTALRAVFYPARTSYLYFRLVDEAAGRHRFSDTLDEHIKAGALFVKRASR